MTLALIATELTFTDSGLSTYDFTQRRQSAELAETVTLTGAARTAKEAVAHPTFAVPRFARLRARESGNTSQSTT